MAELMEATGKLTPIYWLIEKYLEDSEKKSKRARAQLVEALPRILKMLEATE